MKNRYVLQEHIESWMKRNSICDKDITKKCFSKLLGINQGEITSMEVRNRCVNIFTHKSVYKIQLYGDCVMRDLNNRKLFAFYDKELLCPVQIEHKKPLIISMPKLKKISDYDEAACFILRKLKEYGHNSVFNVKDYPLVMYGLNIIRGCPEGIGLSEKLSHYLCEKDGVVLRTGPVHGDFHRGNIMTANGKLFLIDFDCFRDTDIQAVDVLYFILEEVRYKKGYRRSWLEEWLYLYKNIEEIKNGYRCIKQVDIDLQLGLILLFLERLALAQQYEEKFLNLQKNSIRRIDRVIKGL